MNALFNDEVNEFKKHLKEKNFNRNALRGDLVRLKSLLRQPMTISKQSELIKMIEDMIFIYCEKI